MIARNPNRCPRSGSLRPHAWHSGDPGWSLVVPRSTPGRRTAARTKAGFALFNGKDLDGWTPKIKGYDAGENFGDTFRVEDGVLKVAYDKYPKFDGKFGHLFSETTYSNYRLRIEYRFVGDQCPGGPGWAFRNSGVMIHSQSPESMRKDQDFPVSIEVQFLGRQRQGQAADGERLHARHEHRDGRQAHHPALHRLEVQDLPRRRVGHRRGRGPRQRRHQAHRRRRDRARIREAPARRPATPTAAG